MSRLTRLLLLTIALFAGLFAITATAAPVGGVGYVGRRALAQSIDPDVKAAVAAMTVKPDYSQQLKLDKLVRDIKYVCVCWNEIDMLQVYAQHDGQASRVDIRNPSRVATAVNSPSWVAYQGYASDGATSYVNTNFAPASSTILALNSTHVGVWSLTSGQLNSLVEFGSNRESIAIRSLGDNSGTRSNSTTSNNSAAVVTDGSGHFMANRNNSSNYQVYRNAAQYASHTQGSVAVSDGNYFVGTRNDGTGGIVAPSTRRIAVVHAGAALSTTKITALYAALQAYLTSVGAI